LPLVSDRAAVLIEPRCHEYLNLAIKNVLYYLPPSTWSLYIFHSKENESFLKHILHSDNNKLSSIHLICICDTNLTLRDYNLLLTSEMFWNWIKSDYVLIFQTDTYLRKRGIDAFVDEKYAYIGAPWRHSWKDDEKQCGNGGLSLRHRDTMLNVIRKQPFSTQWNEDLWFHSHLRQDKDAKLPDRERGKEFSVETVYFNDPLGVHKYWDYVDKEDVDHSLGRVEIYSHEHE
jgi:hypothetical protein